MWLTNQLTYAYMGALEQGLVPGGTQTRAMMRDHLETRAASINDYYKENLFRPSEISKIRSSNVYLCEDTEWRSLVTYQKEREGHKQRWEVPGVGAGLFFHLRRKMFGENQRVDPDLVGNQDEAQARRSIYAMRKLIVSVGRLMSMDEIQAKGKGGKSSGRESSRTERRDESTPPRERSRRGEREESRHDDDQDRHPERSRSVREPTVSFRSPQREDEDTRGIRLPARMAETGAETTGDENINIDATHVGGGRTRGKLSVRSTASAGEESQAERQRKADREARLKSRVKQRRDDDDDDVMN